jgi:hypothetical protein
MNNDLSFIDLAFILECLKLSDHVTRNQENKSKRLAPILEYSASIQKKVNRQMKELIK